MSYTVLCIGSAALRWGDIAVVYPYTTPEVMYDNVFTPEMKEYVDVIERKSFRDI